MWGAFGLILIASPPQPLVDNEVGLPKIDEVSINWSEHMSNKKPLYFMCYWYTPTYIVGENENCI